MVVEGAIDALISDFQAQPADFLVEAELAFDLKRRINAVLPPATLTGTHDDGLAREDVPNHSAYADSIIDTERFRRAHCEVSGTDFGLSSQEKFDLVVFKPDVHVVLEGGTKRFRTSDVQTIVELKFIKNTHYLRPDSGQYHGIRDDIERLDNAPGDIGRFSLIFSNYDLTHRSDGKEAMAALKSFSDRVSVRYAFPEI